uniref:serine hydrolase domain-containing protein n=1 Tax=unclassified Variovorax TaxID=663243 RepID=UPI000D39ADEC
MTPDAPRDPKRRRYLQWAGLGLLPPVLPGCGGSDHRVAQASATDSDSVADWGRKAIGDAMARSGTGAVSVALWSGGEVVWQEAFGWADSEARIPADTQTRFNTGSVGKVFAALTATILQDRGLLTLDTPVAQYLPEFRMLSDGYRRITVRHLLSHSSGLPGTHIRNVFAFGPHTDYAANGQAALADTHLKHEPGELAVYCNDGFTLIERVVLKLTGQSYPAFVRTNILEPLGMTRSGFTLAPFAPGSFAHPYAAGRQLPQEFVSAYATGGVASTPLDMLRLGRMFMGGGVLEGTRIVSAAGVAEMGRDQTGTLLINPSPEHRLGLGWDSVSQMGAQAVGHTAWQKNGATTFFNNEFHVLPGDDIVLMISGNGIGYGAAALAESIVLRALRSRRLIRALPDPVPLAPPPLADASAPDPSLAAIAGIYGNFRGPIQAVPADGRLGLRRWQAGGWQWMYEGLRLRTDGRWWSETGDGHSFQFQVVRGLRYLVERRPGGSGPYWTTAPLGQQLAPLDGGLSAAWQARVGSTWELANEAPDSVALRNGPVRAPLGVLPELPGYLLWADGELVRPLDDTRAGMTVKVPVNDGRDLSELVFQTVNGVEQLVSNGSVFRRVGNGT